MGTLRGEEIIARCFQQEGVDTIFFMMGGPTSGTAEACLKLGMQGIYVRHEQAAAMMAHAYSRVTGKPGICIAPMGPGVANLVTGLANAQADAAPVIAIGGSAPMRGWTLDTFQEMDQVPMMRPIVKSAYRIDLGYRIPEYISIAFPKLSMASAVRSIWICPAIFWPAKSKTSGLTGSKAIIAPKPARQATRRSSAKRLICSPRRANL
jgi:acetolactate synthase-1/2/3 large subunit